MAKILVVDDDAANRELLTEMLAEFDTEVLEASSGEQCLARCSEDDIATVLLDVMMPGLDGFTVCQRLKEDRKTHLIPVILITALGDRSARIRGMESGADDFLTKPIDRAEFVPRVRSALRAHLAIREMDAAYAVSSCLSSLLEARDPYTHDHAKRVAGYASGIGERLNLTPEELRTLYLGALLHDIGKVGVPDSILLKPGPLTQAERASIEVHPALGAQVCQTIPGLEQVAEVVLRHHERMDGHGYPGGLRGEDIPFLARIVTAADAYDAMTTNRPYRAAMPPEEALAELVRHRGAQFDPVVADTFIELMAESAASALRTQPSSAWLARLAPGQREA